MKQVLIDVDTQHDFCDPSGALYVKGAEKLHDVFRALVSSNRPILASVDSHAFDAWEFRGGVGPNGETPNFPAHCVKGTPGWLKVPGTLPERARFIPNVPIADVAPLLNARAIVLEKEVYSLFANPNAEAVLRHVLGGERGQFIVFGVATDYCVRAAVLGLLEWGEVLIVRDAIAAVDPAGGERAIAECVQRGVKLVTAAEVLS